MLGWSLSPGRTAPSAVNGDPLTEEEIAALTNAAPLDRVRQHQSGVESSCVSDLSDHGVTLVVGQTTSVRSSNRRHRSDEADDDFL